MTTPAKVWQYRTLITNLAARDLRSRYKKSALGWLWSLINPAATLGIYSVVFGIFLGVKAPLIGGGGHRIFALYLFCALVAWNAFAGGINIALQSFLAAGGLLTRTYFPPECPVIAGSLTVVSQTVIESLILVAIMASIGNLGATSILIVPILLLVALFAFGVGLVASLLNVRFRDVTYLVALGLQMLFYATPIVYSESIVDQHSWARSLLQLNPMTHFAGAMRRALYQLEAPTAANWLMMTFSALGAVLAGWAIFSRFAPRFIEEI